MVYDKSVLAIITARGGSKGVPCKNIKHLAGKPLIAWTIEAALASRHLERVVISTDSEEIAEIALRYGAEVPFLRPKALAQDDSPHILAILHALERLEMDENYDPSLVCLLQPTSPLRVAADIDGAIELAWEKRAVAVASVSAAAKPSYFFYHLDPDSKIRSFSSNDRIDNRRQDLPAAFEINGSVYINQRKALIRDQTFYPEDRMYGYLMPDERSWEIDTPWEFHVADLMMRHPMKNS